MPGLGVLEVAAGLLQIARFLWFGIITRGSDRPILTVLRNENGGLKAFRRLAQDV